MSQVNGNGGLGGLNESKMGQEEKENSPGNQLEDRTISNLFIEEKKVDNKQYRLSDFPSELFKSAQSRSGQPNKVILIDPFLEEDIMAYDNNEGREFFANGSERNEFERKT